MDQPVTPSTPKQNLRASQILCLALMIGNLIFAAIISLLVATQGATMPQSEEYGDIFLYAALGIAALCVFFAVPGYNKRIATAKNRAGSLNDKLNLYRALLILYMAPCEFAALFAIIAFFLTGNYYLLGLVFVMLGMMLSRFPFKKRAISVLNLNWQEQQELE
jgi:hypothetical protein